MTDVLDRAIDAVRAIAPKVSAELWSEALVPPMRSSGLVTPRRAAMFLGQCAEESGGFTRLSENLYYTHADRICAVWPSRFDGVEDASHYVANPQALANKVYSDRLGNGDEAGGDGWRFRGMGLIQLTGRAAITRFALAMDKNVPETLTWLQTPTGAAASACWYWIDRGHMLELSDAWDIENVTRRINGALTNLDTRIALCTAALEALS